MRTNLRHFEAKKEINIQRMKLKLVIQRQQIRTFTKNKAEIGNTKSTNLEHFDAKKQITAETSSLKLVKK